MNSVSQFVTYTVQLFYDYGIKILDDKGGSC